MLKLYILIIFIFIASCIPQDLKNNINQKKIFNNTEITPESKTKESLEKNIEKDNNQLDLKTVELSKTIHIVLPEVDEYKYISSSFLNALEIAVFEFNNPSITFEIDYYRNTVELNEIFIKNAKPGKIFIGPLTSLDTSTVNGFCNKKIIIFSFASDRNLAGNCVYLFNFFIEDDLRAIFSYFNNNNKVALIYPENKYGFYINNIIDKYSMQSRSTLVYKLSYKEDLTNIREVIKNLGKYQYRKNELERQKELLKKKNDETSIASLKKLEKFETIGDLDFNTLIISDGNIRILELAPLLPFYDIDPNKIQFVGTGLWDEKSFFDEPSLQDAIFPGTHISKREDFLKSYKDLFNIPPPRTSTIMYDIVSLINFISNNYIYLEDIKKFIDSKVAFDGLDGRFSINNNIIQRDLSILKIIDGKAKLVE